MEPMGSLLQRIDSPEDLRRLSREELPVLCRELRDHIIDVVSANGGHLGASLGVIELTV
ncbi:MAG TPA: 1-deoxy-D-xylulose-5-phosphate synthase N-terminal domain-containing protein, partial [Bacteroidales bacterium]|nr:1-deoxy-D-xylulose-5-phosphate synthase N-terminal domain-containing protein [Bacteroidales bacterium]